MVFSIFKKKKVGLEIDSFSKRVESKQDNSLQELKSIIRNEVRVLGDVHRESIDNAKLATRSEAELNSERNKVKDLNSIVSKKNNELAEMRIILSQAIKNNEKLIAKVEVKTTQVLKEEKIISCDVKKVNTQTKKIDEAVKKVDTKVEEIKKKVEIVKNKVSPSSTKSIVEKLVSKVVKKTPVKKKTATKKTTSIKKKVVKKKPITKKTTSTKKKVVKKKTATKKTISTKKK